MSDDRWDWSIPLKMAQASWTHADRMRGLGQTPIGPWRDAHDAPMPEDDRQLAALVCEHNIKAFWTECGQCEARNVPVLTLQAPDYAEVTICATCMRKALATLDAAE